MSSLSGSKYKKRIIVIIVYRDDHMIVRTTFFGKTEHQLSNYHHIALSVQSWTRFCLIFIKNVTLQIYFPQGQSQFIISHTLTISGLKILYPGQKYQLNLCKISFCTIGFICFVCNINDFLLKSLTYIGVNNVRSILRYGYLKSIVKESSNVIYCENIFGIFF